MELYTKESIVLILEFWQKLTGRLTQLMSGDMSETVSFVSILVVG